MALLPTPTTSTRLPCKSWGVNASMYSCECIWMPSNLPGKGGSGQRASQ